MKRKNNADKKRIGRKKLSRTTRLVILGLIGILLLFSAVNTYEAYRTPTTTQQVIPLLQYNQTGQYDYTVYLKNNTLYNTTSLRPGIGTYFTKLITHINASFSYTFQIDKDATITGEYTLQASIQTNLWTKTYPLVPRTSFNAHGRTAHFTAQFPLNYTSYEMLLANINEETGVSAQNPKLIIQCTVVVIAASANRTISSVFSPSINASLNQKTLEFSKNLTSSLSGVVTTNSIVTLEELPAQRILWTGLSLIFLASMPLFMFITTSTTSENATNKELKKIKKKYGEWIVETTTRPELPESKTIAVTTLEDLSKVGEELGKPILLYTSPNEENHTFYILDEAAIYEYKLIKPNMVNTSPLADETDQEKN